MESDQTAAGPPEDGRPDGGTQPPPPLPPAVRYLRRDPTGPIAGVATGIANYLRVQPIVVQAALVALTIFGGSGILIYLAGWMLIPTIQDPEHRPVAVSSDPVKIFFGVLFAVGAVSALFGSISLGLGDQVILPLLIIGGGIYLLTQRADTPAVAGAPGWTPPQGPPPAPPGPVAGEPTTYAAASATPPPAPSAGTGWNDPTAGPAPSASAADPGGVASFDHPTDTWTQQPAGTHWANTRVADEVIVEAEPPEPTVPVTSITLAIAALVVGVLIGIDQWTDVDVSAYVLFGSALAVVGGGLVFSAFKGRALPLIPIGLLLALGLATAPLTDLTVDGGVGERTYAPVLEDDVRTTYELGAGPLTVDLRNVDFTENHSIEVSVGAGYAEVILPTDVNLVVDATSAAGYVEVFGRENAGLGAELDATVPPLTSLTTPSDETAPADQPTITIEASVAFGYVEVRHGR